MRAHIAVAGRPLLLLLEAGTAAAGHLQRQQPAAAGIRAPARLLLLVEAGATAAEHWHQRQGPCH